MDEVSFLFVLIIGIFGLILGSFLNVVIYRLPRNESIVYPSSYCPVCKTPVKFYDNIPVVSFIILGGKCRSCSAKISPIYPVIEVTTATIGVVLYLINGFSIDFFADFSLGMILLTAAAIDVQYMIIPDTLNITGLLFAIIISLWKGFDGIIRGITGAFVGVVLLIGLFYLGKLLFKREGVGFGDVKLAGVIGFFVGPFWCFISLILAVVAGGLMGILLLVSGRKKIGMYIPFGPFIALGGFLVLFFRIQILYLVEQYLSMF